MSLLALSSPLPTSRLLKLVTTAEHRVSWVLGAAIGFALAPFLAFWQAPPREVALLNGAIFVVVLMKAANVPPLSLEGHVPTRRDLIRAVLITTATSVITGLAVSLSA